MLCPPWRCRMTYILIIPGLPALAWLIACALWLRREWLELRLRYALMFLGLSDLLETPS